MSEACKAVGILELAGRRSAEHIAFALVVEDDPRNKYYLSASGASLVVGKPLVAGTSLAVDKPLAGVVRPSVHVVGVGAVVGFEAVLEAYS